MNAPFADFTWDHARRLAAAASLDDPNEADVARVLDTLLTRAEHGPDIRTARVIGRTRTTALPAHAAAPETGNTPDPGPDSAAASPSAQVVAFGVFDAHAEAERWL
ncbi:hypothetical protein [Streptomyces sp. Ac-502]|uniref:hypothetical protein n=1 Tax=Streptomyces sp. Ac-502 TaxID=3342801 RepID=UPI003862B478